MNKKQSILVVCNTPFQIIVACHVLRCYYRNADVDLYISSGIRGYDKLIANVRETHIFRSVLPIEVEKAFRKGTGIRNMLKYAFKRTKEIILTLRLARAMCKKHYDVVLFSNISILTKRLTTLLTRQSATSRIELFEEGTITYTQQFANGDAETTLYRRLIDKVGVIDRLSALYVFNPIFLSWKPTKGQVIELPKLTNLPEDFISNLNAIFGYTSDVDKYDKKLIFFEESHAMEGFDVPDIQILEQIAQKVGKENIMVKIHPRNPENRFAKLGYKTNVVTSIPWELIILNQSMKGKTLVTISSGSVIYPYLYFGIPIKTYSLLNCLSERPGLMKGDNGILMQKIYATYPDVFIVPTSLKEFINML
ncbi:MAG: alpha-2,8-polysialyltransferase family protein [Paludibacteraceae bacterium]|nr:alpha-2,8-polysialyltransferase family protein [Paludibacteraceae bacterium]